jgi:signal transduction histidine kinase
VAVLSGVRRPDPVLYAIVALLGAVALVIYLQHRSLTALERQTRIIVQKIAEQTATAAANEIRRTFEGPVFETLSAVNHPLLRAGRFELVAQHYAEGLAKFPQVERFFLWHSLTDPLAPGEALFFDGEAHPEADDEDDEAARRPGAPEPTDRLAAQVGRGPMAALASFYRDPPFGRLLYRKAQELARSQWIYAAVETEVGRTRYDAFFRLFWVDANRDEFFAVLGFVVNHDAVRRDLFAALHRQKLARLLNPADGSPTLELRVVDDRGEVVYGPPAPWPEVAARAQFRLQFYPVDEIRPRMAAEVPTRRWSVVVSPAAGSGTATVAAMGAQGYGLSVLSVLLMLVALTFTLRSRQKAAQLARMQADFVSYVSHQLKTPLSLLNAVLETLDLERVRSSAKLAEYLRIARAEAARLTSLVERILEFSRVQGSARSYELERVNLLPLVQETVDAFRQALAHEGVSVVVEPSGPSPVVAADPAAIEQVLVNLLDNAVKYSYGRREVLVRVGAVGSEAVIEVVDRGIGIRPEELPRIFDRFYRGSGAALNRQGFGLGLAIARELVAAHRGRIEVDSVVERGSTFRVRLPLDRRHGRSDLAVVQPGAREQPLRVEPPPAAAREQP